MKYTVTWLPQAEAMLAQMWKDHPLEHAAITAASDRIDMLLKDDPDLAAKKMHELWTLTIPPLAVLLKIDPSDRMVKVLQVRKTK